jgi:protein involved in polysaccharide export with SLBB domain
MFLPAKVRSRVTVQISTCFQPGTWLVLVLVLVMNLALNAPVTLAQSIAKDGRTKSSFTASRADQAAEETVSLSAEQIIEILRREPGLLLAVKKALVREAFAQGRLIEAADLQDEALYGSLREDDHVRVLATREIEARKYVRAKPTPEEEQAQEKQERESGRLALAALPANQAGSGATPRGDTLGRQEEIYWERHDYSSPGNAVTNPAAPATTRPQPNPTLPQDLWPQNPARSVQRTSMRDNFPQYGATANGSSMDQFEGGAIDADSLEPIGSRLPSAVSGGNSHSPVAAAGEEQAGAGSPDWNLSGDAGTGPSPASVAGNSDLASFESPREQPPASGIEDVRHRPQSASSSSASSSVAWDAPPHQPVEQDRPVILHRANPYANVPSLYDLYTQVAGRSPALSRFGLDVFRNRNGNLDALPMDLPVGPDYVLGPGDGLNIQLSGSVAQRLARVVDPEGRVALPEVGAIEVSGRNLGDAQRLVQATLRTEFHDVRADLALSRIRTVRVYVVGDVESPGAYDISSLSTALNALYAAGGPTTGGSLRHLRQYRGKTLVQEIDAYDLLLHGIHSELSRLEAGDTLLVPPLGPVVTVQGMVQRPAIYELGSEKNLAEVLELAGGVLSSGSLRHVDVERTLAHESRTMLRLDLPENNDQQAVNVALDHFEVQDGDKIKISPILPYANQTVYLDGHVFHPGKYPYKDGMRVTDILHSYSDLMPER